MRFPNSDDAILIEVLRPTPGFPIKTKWYWEITADLITVEVSSRSSSLIVISNSWFSLPRKLFVLDNH